MMPAAGGMSHVISSHVLRVGQTVCLDSVPNADPQKPGCHLDDPDLDMTLENLNQIMMDLDPSFEPIPVPKSPCWTSPPTDSDQVSHCVLVPRGCSPTSKPTSASPSIPIPTQRGLGCSPQGAAASSSSPTSSLPPLPCGSAPRRNPSSKQDFPHGSLRTSRSNRGSATSLLSTSTCSDTSYVMGSNLSLTGEDTDFLDCSVPLTPGSFSDGSRTGTWDCRPTLTKQGHLPELHREGVQSCPVSLSGSQTDIPLLLINGAPESDVHSPRPDPIQKVPASPSKQNQVFFSGSQPMMKFVMDTSKFWFRPHISRAEADALLKDKDAGTFVVRESTTYRGSFGLAMKVDGSPTSFTAAAYPGESSSDRIRHFLIESSAKGVRIGGSSQEPYFGSLSALVYQHTISAYALPCKLLLHHQDLSAAEKRSEKAVSEDKNKTACNFVYLDAVPTEMLTGPCAVQKAVSTTLKKAPASFTPTVVNMKVSLKGVTLTDINRKLFFRRHYPAHLLSHSGKDPDGRLWWRGTSFGARMFGFVAKGVEAGMENVCHVFAEYDPLQPCSSVVTFLQAALAQQ
nr:tensin-4 [Nothobranchius furzeri]XP_054599885.1 tensin-4 [Nothobranchius furzeri]XP_054599886.1 tensin-4 [Nothobranchius furzeri]XP_054599887.1 tensin-4 [Nothobranchius furzeri]